jgi:hypothetical protein
VIWGIGAADPLSFMVETKIADAIPAAFGGLASEPNLVDLLSN